MRSYRIIYISAALSSLIFASTAGAAGYNGSGSSGAPGGGVAPDVAFISLAHCAGVAEGTGADAAPFETVLKMQSDLRTADVLDRAEEARTDARRRAEDAGPDGRAAYERERDRQCRALLPQV
jgi:hypothetical protein